MRRAIRALVAFAVGALATPAPIAARQPAPPPALDSALIAAFQGSWHCAGAFANLGDELLCVRN